MPESKKRKKKGKPAPKRGDDRMSGVTLQDLINVLAYQEHENKTKMSETKEND
jgi:hypothetical protein